MTARLQWRDALLTLHTRAWEADDVDAACEALLEACEEGEESGIVLEALSLAEVADVLDSDITAAEATALLVIAPLRCRDDDEARALQHALYDLDAFAYDYAGDD